MRSIKQLISLLGVMSRKTAWKTFLVSLVTCGFLFISTDIRCMGLNLLFVSLCLISNFKGKNKGGIITLRRFPVSRITLRVAYGAVAVLNYVFGTLLLKAGVLLKVLFEIAQEKPTYSLALIIESPIFFLRAEEYNWLSMVFPFSNWLVLIVYAFVVLVLSYFVSGMVCYEE